MYLRDFAEIRGIKPDTVASYIRKHPEIAEFTSMEGKFMVLSDEAVELLDKKYPLPKPIQVIEDTESRKKLIEAQQVIIKMQQAMLEMADEKEKLAIQAEKVLMLEQASREKDQKISSQSEELADLKAVNQQLEARAGTAEQELAEARQELERLQKRNLWQRIFNK